MRNTFGILLGILLGGLGVQLIGGRVHAQQTHPPRIQLDNLAMNEGRYQVVHLYYSADRQGTGMIDSATGDFFQLAVSKDTAGNEDWSFQQLPVSTMPKPR
jgi:hypothetical protein